MAEDGYALERRLERRVGAQSLVVLLFHENGGKGYGRLRAYSLDRSGARLLHMGPGEGMRLELLPRRSGVSLPALFGDAPVLAYGSESAGFGRRLHLLSFSGGRLESLAPPLPDGELKDIDGDGRPEIVFRSLPLGRLFAVECPGFVSLARPVKTEVLEWRSGRLRPASGRYPAYYRTLVAEEEKRLAAMDPGRDGRYGDYIGAALSLYFDRSSLGSRREAWDRLAGLLRPSAEPNAGAGACLQRVRSELRRRLSIPEQWDGPDARALDPELREYVHKAYWGDIQRITLDLIAFRTVADKELPTTDAPEFVKLRGYLKKLAASYGMRYATYDGEQIVVLSVGEGPETLAFYTHGDVVPAKGPWANLKDPFRPEIKGGNIYGRGALDDKGPVASILLSMKAMVDRKLLPAGKSIALVITTKEEKGDWDGLQAFSEKMRFKWNIVADGLFPALIAEKGGVAGFFSLPLDAAPASWGEHPYRILSLDAGIAPNQMAAEARATLRARDARARDALLRALEKFNASQDARYRIGVAVEASPEPAASMKLLARGVAGHASTPAKWHNATTDLVEFLAGLDLEPGARASIVRCVHKVFGRSTDGSSIGIAVSNDSLYDPPGSTMVSTMLREEGGAVKAGIDIRFHDRFKKEEVLRRLLESARSVAPRVKVETWVLRDPFFISPDDPFVRLLVGIYNAETGSSLKPKGIGGGTQVRVLSGEHRITFGPALDVSAMHSDDERISLETLLSNTYVYLAAMKAVVGQ